VYVEKPGPIELTVEKHAYEVTWLNPANGETTEDKKFNSDHFTGEPPGKSHDWVLFVHRNAHLGGYKFESRPVPVQEIEQDAPKVPFTIAEPKVPVLSVAAPAYYAAKLTRESRATRSMLYLWTAEVIAEGQGFRVIGTGPEGTLIVPPNLAVNFPALLNLRVSALNAYGKAYQLDKVYKLVR
ncbi:MAG: putative collagen-binding domain-containing protein, partial [Pseudomonadota bacterium]